MPSVTLLILITARFTKRSPQLASRKYWTHWFICEATVFELIREGYMELPGTTEKGNFEKQWNLGQLLL